MKLLTKRRSRSKHTAQVALAIVVTEQTWLRLRILYRVVEVNEPNVVLRWQVDHLGAYQDRSQTDELREASA